MIKKGLFLLIMYAALFSACSDNNSPQIKTVSKAQIELAISGSDNYKIHKEIFITSAKTLLENGTCNLSELKDMGGWVKSQNHKNEPIYFTYCGGMKIQNKIYLNVSTGNMYK